VLDARERCGDPEEGQRDVARSSAPKPILDAAATSAVIAASIVSRLPEESREVIHAATRNRGKQLDGDGLPAAQRGGRRKLREGGGMTMPEQAFRCPRRGLFALASLHLLHSPSLGTRPASLRALAASVRSLALCRHPLSLVANPIFCPVGSHTPLLPWDSSGVWAVQFSSDARHVRSSSQTVDL
jgi:hypothetical protein